MIQPMKNFLPGRDHPSGGDKRFACSKIARIARMGAAGDNKSKLVSAPEPIGGRPTGDGDSTNARCIGIRAAWAQAQITIADLKRPSLRVNIAKAGKEVRVLPIRPHRQLDLDRPDGVAIAIER